MTERATLLFSLLGFSIFLRGFNLPIGKPRAGRILRILRSIGAFQTQCNRVTLLLIAPNPPPGFGESPSMAYLTGRPQLKTRLCGGNHCDFCGTLFVKTLFACNNFEWVGRHVFRASTGRWAACAECGKLIDGDKWDRLVTRAMQARRANLTPGEVKLLRRDLRLLYVAIKANMLPGHALTIQQPHYSRRQAG